MLQDITSDGCWAENGWCLFSENERSRCHRCEIRLFSLWRIVWNISHNGTLAWFSLVSIFQWHSLGERRRGSNYFTIDYIKLVESGESNVPLWYCVLDLSVITMFTQTTHKITFHYTYSHHRWLLDLKLSIPLHTYYLPSQSQTLYQSYTQNPSAETAKGFHKLVLQTWPLIQALTNNCQVPFHVVLHAQVKLLVFWL